MDERVCVFTSDESDEVMNLFATLGNNLNVSSSLHDDVEEINFCDYAVLFYVDTQNHCVNSIKILYSYEYGDEDVYTLSHSIELHGNAIEYIFDNDHNNVEVSVSIFNKGFDINWGRFVSGLTNGRDHDNSGSTYCIGYKSAATAVANIMNEGTVLFNTAKIAEFMNYLEYLSDIPLHDIFNKHNDDVCSLISVLESLGIDNEIMGDDGYSSDSSSW